MCIFFVYVNSNPEPGKYRLILATNRDEYFNRPASPAHKWLGHEHIIGGEDLEPGREGGTWFGMSLKRNDVFNLRAGALLNITGEDRSSDAIGRGCIVSNYLKSDLTTEDFVEDLSKDAAKYNAFGFVGVELDVNGNAQILHYSNISNLTTRPKSKEHSVTFAEFGNSLPNEPLAKVTAGGTRFRKIVDQLNSIQQRNELVTELESLLKWDQRHLPDPVLARRTKAKGALGEYLSSVFVNIPAVGYGTRTHTILLVGEDGRVEFVEDTLKDPPSETGGSEWVKQTFFAHL